MNCFNFARVPTSKLQKNKLVRFKDTISQLSGTNTRPIVTHVTANILPIVTHVTTTTRLTVTHVTTNTRHTVTHVATGTKPTISSDTDGITVVTTIYRKRSAPDEHAPEGKFGQYEKNLIDSQNGWLDCVIVHEAYIILKRICNDMQGFQRPTLGPIHQFDIMTGPFIQIVNINTNYWI